MKRIAIFAHYSKDNKIDDYVIFYLKELKEVAESIIFVSDSNIEAKELDKIKEYTITSIAKHHGEYDFDSYKRGFIYALENNLLSDYDELIFANDSCYAPLFPFNEMFNVMSYKKLDFWGASQNGWENQYSNIPPHIQSFFIVFKNNVFISDYFIDFITSIKKQDSKHKLVIEYEIGLTLFLEKHNLFWNVYSEISKTVENATLVGYKKMIMEDKFPFIKRSLILLKEQKVNLPIGIKKFIIKNTKYNFELIENDKKKNLNKFNIFHFLTSIRKKLFKIHLSEHRISILGKWYYLKKGQNT